MSTCPRADCKVWCCEHGTLNIPTSRQSSISNAQPRARQHRPVNVDILASPTFRTHMYGCNHELLVRCAQVVQRDAGPWVELLLGVKESGVGVARTGLCGHPCPANSCSR